MNPAIEIRDVSVSLGGRHVLRHINLSLEEGHFLGIVGPNGGGKTTLVRAVLGIIRPSTGQITVMGRQLSSIPGRETVFGYLPQHLNIDPNFPATSRDIVLMGRYSRTGLFRWPGRQDREKAAQCLALMGIERLGDVPYSRLSGGEQQRVNIARALAGEPRILILDEPSTGIDVVGQEDFYHLLKGLQRKLALTILMVSHDIGTVTAYVDEIACLNIQLSYHGNPLGALDEKVMTSLYGRSVDMLMHSDVCDRCERLRQG